MTTSKDSVMVICAHSDDQVIGVGGTLAKYVEEGKDVNVIIFSYGEKSHPWLKKEVIAETRVNESKEAQKVLGITGTQFLGLEEGKFKDDIKEKKIEAVLRSLFRKYKPTRIFTHSPDDPHPDHNTLSGFLTNFCEKISYDGDVYCFDVWTPVSTKKSEMPKMVVDISSTFKKKRKALKCFKSQKWNAIIPLMFSIWWGAWKNGRKNNVKYAEVFYKLR
jgi:LmbE family N-acetylglucosaminyl deacetylase